MLPGMLMLMATALPPNPKRETPPQDLEKHAVPVGAPAPAFTLPDATGAQTSLHGPAVIIFYRGHW